MNRGPAPGPVPGYDWIEGSHLRQWALRAVAPTAVLMTNGAGAVRVSLLPAHDAPLAWFGVMQDTQGFASGAIAVTGGALVLSSAALRVAAKGVLVRRTTVTTAGAYGLVRHPFYLANLLGAAGTFAIAGPLGAAACVVWLAVAAPLYAVTIRGEERGLRLAHGAAWDAYAAAVPRLVPRRWSWGSGASVTWGNLVAEGEPPRGLRFLAGAALVAAARTGGAAGAWVAAAALAAWAASHVVGRSRRRAPG